MRFFNLIVRLTCSSVPFLLSFNHKKEKVSSSQLFEAMEYPVHFKRREQIFCLHYKQIAVTGIQYFGMKLCGGTTKEVFLSSVFLSSTQ